jgi:hypothetical protein
MIWLVLIGILKIAVAAFVGKVVITKVKARRERRRQEVVALDSWSAGGEAS